MSEPIDKDEMDPIEATQLLEEIEDLLSRAKNFFLTMRAAEFGVDELQHRLDDIKRQLDKQGE